MDSIRFPGLNPQFQITPKFVQGLKTKVDEQIDHLKNQEKVDLSSLTESLQQLSGLSRTQHPTKIATDADRLLHKNIGQIHSSANKIASYASLINSGALAGPAALEVQAFLEVQRKQLEKSVSGVFSQEINQTAKIGATASKAKTDSIKFVDVPAGTFKAGYDGHSETTGDYQISKYPVTNRQYAEFVKETGYQSQGQWSLPEGDYPKSSDSLGEHPVTHVTFYDAKAFCEWAGVRLPKENEWEKAARGTDGRKFPWGDEFRPELLNADGSGTTPVTQFEKPGPNGLANVSPFGAVDMVGNVLEWVDEGVSRRPGSVLLKGGAFTNYLPNDSVQPFDTIRHTSESPESCYAGFGFRVCLDGLSPKDQVTTPKGQGLPSSSQQASSTSFQPPAAIQQQFVQKGILTDFDSGLLPLGSSGKLTPGKELPTFYQQSEIKLTQAAQEFKQTPGTPQLKTLQEILKSISSEVRSTRPLTAVDQDVSQKKIHGDTLALANRIANYASLASTGSPLAGITLAACFEQVESGVEKLKDNLHQLPGLSVTASTSSLENRDLCKIEPVLIPEGEFLFGRNNEKVTLPAFEVSKHPVTNKQFLAFVQETGYKPEGGWHSPSNGSYGDSPDSLAEHPVVNVSYFDAQAFAKWVGGRLPNEQEWEKSSRGTEGFQFPWGNDWRPEAVNHDSDGTIPVQQVEAANNVSPFGVAGGVGNVLQWVDDSTDQRPGSVVLKGGAWSNGTGNLKVFNAVRRTTENPLGAYGGFGFRVAWDVAEDSTHPGKAS
jgi:formylglycine-generating enzyme required for sulfatase activity